MEIRHRPRTTPRSSWATTIGVAIASFAILVLVSVVVSNQRDALSSSSSLSQSSHQGPRVKVFYQRSDQPAARKLAQELYHSPLVDAIELDPNHPPAFVASQCPGATERLQELLQPSSTGSSTSSPQPHLALEVLKYCALQYHKGGLYLDADSPLMDTLDHLLSSHSATHHMAVLNDPFLPKSIHGALLWLNSNANNNNNNNNNSKRSNMHGDSTKIASDMLQILLTTNLQVLESNPLLLSKSLYDLIATHAGVGKLSAGPVGDSWFVLQHSCTIDPLGGRQVTAPVSTYALKSYRLTQNCPEPNGFCCSIFDPIEHLPTMMTKHLLLPYQILPRANQLPKPLNAEAGHYEEEDLPYIATISVITNTPPEQPLLTPNFFEILLQNDCLPSDKKCSDCLRDKKGSNCQKCASVCPCYCKTLCHIPVEEKFVHKELTVRPPLYARDPSRLIPRIVHQTWFEDVTPEKYPNMSRLIESFKQSGWDYKFYTDDEARNFLSTHFPPELRQAYDALRPGAFKADLFRYCVLMIHGGVYADMDIMLETNLDLAVGPDVGFMVPQDEPGTPVNHRMCLWNGFIAAAPGHPFLAKVIETVVNNVRNRFTSVDVDHLFCPDPELSILHAFDTLFTAGPCILGAMVNKVLGRHGQTPFEAGEMDIWQASKAQKKKNTKKGDHHDFVIGVDDRPSARIPGRTIILHQNKWDMGAHRFTLLDKNLVVAATDLPDADDRVNQEKPPEHYSKTHVKTGIYGLDVLYVDNEKANEELRFYVDAQWKRYAGEQQ